jgi:putative SOS response-associated peptidase YedK
MCGRFGLYLEEGFGKRFEVFNDFDLPVSYNIAPGQSTIVITHNSPNKGELMRWGLIPPWAKDVRIAFKMINARAETILEKPSYRNPFKTKRCLVPFNCFYEWKQDDKEKTPNLFHDKGNKFLSFAGLYEIAHDADGKEIKSFTIITTKANQSMGGVHERMPVILSPEEESIWLNHDTESEKLLELLDGYSSETFEHYEISNKVNSASNNDPSLLERIGS